MGAISPACRIQDDLPSYGCKNLVRVVAMGKATTPEERSAMRTGRYFHTLGIRRWNFADKAYDTASSRTSYMRFDPLSATPIQRHAKIKGEYNPFDPAWEREGEILRTRRMMNSLQYRTEIARLYQQQRGKCVHCRLPITRESGWHDHYLLPRIQGGKDTTNNRVLLHPDCHDQIHNFGISVYKPAREAGLVKA